MDKIHYRILISLLMLAVLLIISVYFRPNISHIDFLTLSLTIFSISLALVVFISPILQEYRGTLFELDKSIVELQKTKVSAAIDMAETKKLLNEVDEFLNNVKNKPINENDKKKIHDENRELTEKKSILERYKSRMEEHPESFYSLSSPITQQFEAIKKRIRHCLIMIGVLILVNYILFNSPKFSSIIHEYFTCLSNLSEWKNCISIFINITTLTMQLYFLYQVSMITMNTIKQLNSKKG